MDPTGFEPFPPGGPYWHRVGGKVIIDATKPPLCAGEEKRKAFQRLKPMGWETVQLEDFLPEAGLGQGLPGRAGDKIRHMRSG
jgi:hypothetical protein